MSFQDYADSFLVRMRAQGINRKAVIGAIAILAALAMAMAVSWACLPKDEGFNIQAADAESAEPTAEDEAAAQAEKIYVHVAGAVANPGICALDSGARVADAISAVGGFADGAATDSVNLARPLEDGEQVMVLGKEQMQGAGEEATGANGAVAGNMGTALVNINTASSDELQEIDGIGAAKAKKIIDYREKMGPFKKVEDITNVSGFGEKTLESIRDQICV